MAYTYKHLSNSDVDFLKKLRKVFGEAFNDVATYQDTVPSVDYLRGLLSEPHVMVVVAKSDEEVVGGLVAYELDKFEQDRREIYIYDLAVADQRRT